MQKQLHLLSNSTIICIAIIFELITIPVSAFSDASSAKDTVKIGMALGGAVSLGSFHGGVIYQFLSTLEKNNQDANSTTHYEIDIMAGASAGSMTIAMIAKVMASGKINGSEGQSNVKKYKDNIFYKSWVEEIDILDLLPAEESASRTDPFIFSNKKLNSIADKYLITNDSICPLSIMADSVYLGMTLSNMEGIKRKLAFSNLGSDLQLSRYIYSDIRYFKIFWAKNQDLTLSCTESSGKSVLQLLNDEISSTNHTITWNEISETSKASGAFPFAFPPIQLKRYAEEFKEIPENFEGGIKELGYNYVDGGFFNNDPLSVVLTIADKIDGQTKSRPHRIFIYFDAEASLTDSKTENNKNYYINPATNKFGKYLGQLIKMGLGTANDQDFKQYLIQKNQNQSKINKLLKSIYTYYQCSDSSGELNTVDIRATEVDKALAVLRFYENRREMRNELPTNIKFLSQIYNSTPEVYEKYRGKNEKKYNPENITKLLNWRIGSIKSTSQELIKVVIWLKSENTPSNVKELYIRLFDLQNIQYPQGFKAVTNLDLSLVGKQYAAMGGFLNQHIRDFDYYVGLYSGRKFIHENFPDLQQYVEPDTNLTYPKLSKK